MLGLAGELGLAETEKMTKLRNQIVEFIKSGREFKGLYLQYENLIMGIAEQYRDDAFKKAQIAHLILEASIFREGGDLEGYKEKINQAIEYAYGMHWDDMAEQISSAK